MKFSLACCIAALSATMANAHLESERLSPKAVEQIEAFLEEGKLKNQNQLKRPTKRRLRMMKKKSNGGKSSASCSGNGGKGGKGKNDNGITSSNLRLADEIFIMPVGCDGECLQDQVTASPSIVPCNPNNAAQVWNIIPVSGTFLPLFQVQGDQSGLCVGTQACADNQEGDVIMLPCSDPRTHWFSPTGVLVQSYYCFKTLANVETFGAGLYWTIGGSTNADRTYCDEADSLQNDDPAYSGGIAFFPDRCEIEEIVSRRRQRRTLA